MSDAMQHDHDHDDAINEMRDIAEVPAVELINTVAIHLLSAAAVKVGLADDPDQQLDLDEARKLINALAGLVTAAAAEIGGVHAAPLRDGLRSVQLAFRESFLAYGDGTAAYVAFTAFYLVCAAVTWAVYLRPSPVRLTGV